MQERRIGHLREIAMRRREIVRGRLADFGNGQRVQPARQRQAARALDRREHLLGVLRAENARLFLGAEVQLARASRGVSPARRDRADRAAARARAASPRRCRRAPRSPAHRASRDTPGGASSARGRAGFRSARRRIPGRARSARRTPGISRRDARRSRTARRRAGASLAPRARPPGMTSPAFSMTTVSPMRMSLRRISSSLCSVARAMVLPRRKTGSSSATGVSVPVRPTCTVMSCSTRLRLLRREFVRLRPARRARGVAGPLALLEGVQLDHRAIRLEAEAVAQRVELPDRRHDFREIAAAPVPAPAPAGRSRPASGASPPASPASSSASPRRAHRG